MKYNKCTTRRKAVASLGSVALGGVLTGCNTREDEPNLSIEKVWMEITETSALQVFMRVSNSGDEVGEPMARVKITRDDELIGEKKQTLVTIPMSQSMLQGTFSPLEKNVPRSEYTASGTLPDQRWVTASES